MAKLNTFYQVLIGVAVAVCLGLAIGLPIYFLTGKSEIEVESKPSAFRVIPNDPLIQLKEGDLETAQPYVNELNSYLKKYSDAQDVIDCNEENRPKDNQVCKFSLDWFSACQSSKDFGLTTSRPCIFLALSLEDKDSKIEPYQSTSELPDDMPEDLKIEIELSMENEKLPQGIWVSCSNNVYLVEPWHIFYDYYYDNILPVEEGYLPPLVAMKFNLKNIKNQDVKIECNLWAKNLDPKAEANKVSFTLRVDE